VNEINMAVFLYLVSQGIDTGHAATRLVPSTAIRHRFRARGNCCAMWVAVVADEVVSTIDIAVTGSPVAHRCTMEAVTRFLELANDGDTFGRFSVEANTGAVYYATTAAVDAARIDSRAIGIAVQTAGTRYDRLYPSLLEVMNGADPERQWLITEQPDWDRISSELHSVACRPFWGPPQTEPALGSTLRLPTEHSVRWLRKDGTDDC